MHLLVPLAAQEAGALDAEYTTLWVADDGAAMYWRSGLDLAVGECCVMGFDLGQVNSSLPWLNGSVFAAGGHVDLDLDTAELSARFGFFDQPPGNAVIQKAAFSSEGGGGFFFSFETPLYFGPLSVTPYLLHSEASWHDGDLYWFFGKPGLPSLWSAGLAIGLNQRNRYSHELGFRAFAVNINLVSNESQPLFAAQLDGAFWWYRYAIERNTISFSGTAGWLYAKTAADGALTMANQPYFLFPFRFCNLNASIETHTGFAMLRFQHSPGIFRYRLDFGIGHIFSAPGSIDVHYQMKGLFGGQEAFYTIEPQIAGIGAAFLLAEIALPSLPLSKSGKQRLFLGLRKAFAVPWGYWPLLASFTGSAGEAPAPSADEALSVFKSVMLSGLSICGSISW